MPAFQAGYDGSIPLSRSKVILIQQVQASEYDQGKSLNDVD